MIARRYGASFWHLAGHLAYLALAGYVLARMLDRPAFSDIVAWLLAAVVLHDLVALPLYTALDRLLWRLAPRRVAAVVRTVAVLGGLTLLVYFPPPSSASTRAASPAPPGRRRRAMRRAGSPWSRPSRWPPRPGAR